MVILLKHYTRPGVRKTVFPLDLRHGFTCAPHQGQNFTLASTDAPMQ
jgi:hypothetical protein